ncbi:MAG TPA: hypothetical protein VHA07_15100 [Devosia sp.]|nr:hypothetical protein [Devosia sp.]
MKYLSCLALAMAVAAAGVAAAPAFAAAPAGGVPMCNTGGAQKADLFQQSADQLVHSRAFAGRTVQSVDQWNNCIKVIYQDGKGSVTAFYDPDTLRLIDSMRNG